jgi:hypothetical protein
MSEKPTDSSRLSRTLQPLLWFLLMASTLACASNLALGLVS